MTKIVVLIRIRYVSYGHITGLQSVSWIPKSFSGFVKVLNADPST